MQPAQNPAQSHSVQNSRVLVFVIALLIFGALKGWPLLLAQAPELMTPVPATPAAITQEAPSPITKAEDKKDIGFDEKYKDWAAVMVLCENRVTVREDWSYEANIRRKILVQTKDGSVMGEIPILYDADTEEVRVLRVVTITPDGKEHSPAKIQELSVYEGYGMYSGAKRKILSMPEVTPGSIIDLEYVKITKRLPMPGTFWDIQDTEQAFPVKEQKIIYRIPKSLGVQFKSFIPSWVPVIREKGGDTIYSWERKNYGPDTDPEEGLKPPPTVETIGDGIEFSSVKSWQDVAAWYYDLIQKNLKLTPEITKAAVKAVKGKKSLRDKVRAILEYMHENFRYVSMSFGDYSMVPHSTDDVFRNKYGDCKDQSLLVKAMLQAIGIQSEFSLFMEEFDGNDPKEDLPVPGLYDHVLLKVYDPEGGDFYADPLLEGYDIGEYPLGYQGAYTFVITSEGGRFEKLPVFDAERLSESKIYKIEIEPNGSATEEVEHLWDLGDSIDFRAQVKAMSAEEKGKFFEYLENEVGAGGKVLKIEWDGLDAKYGRIKSTVKTNRPDQYPVNDGLIVVDLPSISRPDGWGQKERKSPVFFPVNVLRRNEATYQIPAGFEVMHLPKGINLDNGFYSIHRDIEMTDNLIKVKEIKRTQRLEVPASEYPRLKEFYDKLPSLTEQRIILRKKNGPA